MQGWEMVGLDGLSSRVKIFSVMVGQDGFQALLLMERVWEEVIGTDYAENWELLD